MSRKRKLTGPFPVFCLSTMGYHIVEETMLLKTPIQNYFTKLVGMDPWTYADEKTIEYTLLIWGIPAFFGIATAIIRKKYIDKYQR